MALMNISKNTIANATAQVTPRISSIMNTERKNPKIDISMKVVFSGAILDGILIR
jgi:hypothetical protein